MAAIVSWNTNVVRVIQSFGNNGQIVHESLISLLEHINLTGDFQNTKF
jgi:hypothetical protein